MLKHTRSAQSLLEAIIAIGVILVATISSTTLVVSTINAGRVSTDKIEAANYAREGLEVVREIRDSNWLKEAQNVVDGGGTTVQWDDSGLITDGYDALDDIAAAGSARCRLTVFDPSTGWSLPKDFSRGNSPCLSGGGQWPINDKIQAITIGGQTYMSNLPSPSPLTSPLVCPPGATCTPTKYLRALEILKVAPADPGGDAPTGDYYLVVTSIVQWNSHGPHTLTMSERLYDWR